MRKSIKNRNKSSTNSSNTINYDEKFNDRKIIEKNENFVWYEPLEEKSAEIKEFLNLFAGKKDGEKAKVIRNEIPFVHPLREKHPKELANIVNPNRGNIDRINDEINNRRIAFEARLNRISYQRSTVASLEKKINEYITLKLEHGRTMIYVAGKRFMQCIRLILNIPRDNMSLYDEIDSIDEAAKLYTTHIHQNRIIGGRPGVGELNQNHSITPEQEFWGHCSNIQAWVEHDYDTRILMSNISFPLLRELTKAGDPKAKMVYKEEIALRLESGYPSVVQYLLSQGYIQVFTSSEFKTILEATNIIKKLSSEPRILSEFLRSCVFKFPDLLKDILLQILLLPNGKNIFLSSIQLNLRAFPFNFPPTISRFRYFQVLPILKTVLENLSQEVDTKIGDDITDCILIINDKLEEQVNMMNKMPERFRSEISREFLLPRMLLDRFGDDQNPIFRERILEQIQKKISRCSYCGRIIAKDRDTCEWCGHKKDDDGFFPYPFIYKRPGGGGGSSKGAIAVAVKVKSYN